jgi:uncharacterized MAPEG superfamily protein
LPYAAFAFLAPGLDASLPRVAAANVEGLKARASGAHLNAFEAFGFFAASVIIAHIVEGPSSTINWLAMAFIVVRVGHMAFYLADRQPLRSTCFGLGMLLIAAIFLHAAFH